MRIAFMAYDGKNYSGGPIVNACRLLPALQKRGHTVCALIPFMGGDAPNVRYLEANGVLCKAIPFHTYTEDMVYWVLNEIKHFQPDIFIPNISFQGGFAARWVRNAGIPTVIAHRSNDELNWCLFQTFVAGKPKWRVNGLMCVSHSLKEESLRLMHHKIPVAVIPSGVPESNYISTQENGTLKVVYAGRLVQNQKRIWDIINTFIEILKEDTEVEFTMIGDGIEREGLERKVRESGFEKKITFKGRLSGEEYHKELSTHHVVVLMSDYEGTPGSLMDGMVCGLVPISLDIKGIKELVKPGETGIIINSRNDLKSVLIQLKSTSYRKQLSANALLHIQKHYSIDLTVNKWEKFCYQLIKSGAREKKRLKLPKKLNLPFTTMKFEGSLRKQTILFSITYFFHRVKNKILKTAKTVLN